MTNIKASEVLKEIKMYSEDLPHYSPDEVAEALEMGSRALEQTRWIPCSERMPKDYSSNLCTIRNHYTYDNHIEVYDHLVAYNPAEKEWLDEFSKLAFEVIAWMPIPEPYKAESEEVYENKITQPISPLPE